MNQPPQEITSQATTPAQMLQNLARDLWRYKWVVPAVTLLVAGIVAFRTSREPKIYEAVASLEYDPRPAMPLGRELQDVASSYDSWNTYEFYETQNHILQSRSLAERVVRKLGLHLDPDYGGNPSAEEPSAASVERAAQAVQGQITVAQVPDTRIIHIKVQDQNGDRAQLIANAVADAYIEKSLEDRMGTSVSALEWLSGQMSNLKRELEDSEHALYKFRQENQSLSASLEERQKIIAAQLHSYNSTLTELRTQRVKASARLAVLKEMISGGDDVLALQAGPIGLDPHVAELRAKYYDVATELKKLAVTYGPAHPLVQTAQSEVDLAASQLRSQIEAIVAAVEAELRELTQSERGIEQALAEVNRQGLELSLQETEYTQLDRERQSRSELYALVMERAAQTDLARAVRAANARIVDRALRPQFAVSPRVRSAVTMGVVLGLMLGVALALGIAQLDNKVRSTADLEARGLTVLGVIPEVANAGVATARKPGRRARKGGRVENPNRDLIVHLEPRSSVAECCRTIRTNLTFQSADKPLRALGVTSAMPRDGKTTVAISLAITMAQSGRRVLLIDADLRKPRLHRAFDLPTGAGITTVIAGESSLQEAVQATDVPGLNLVQCGPIPPNPSELLHTRRFAEFVEEARANYDLVIFDTPPLGAVTDPAIISNFADGMILVARARTTTRGGLALALRQLHGVSARIVGTVLNDVDLTENMYGSYYANYRGYYGDPENDTTPTVSKASTSG